MRHLADELGTFAATQAVERESGDMRVVTPGILEDLSAFLSLILFSFLSVIFFRYWAYRREGASISGEPKRTDHIKHRNMVAQISLFFFTVGTYAIYWYYVTLKELHIANRKKERVLWWTVLLLIPLANIFSWWHYASEVGTFTRNKWLQFVIFFRYCHSCPLSSE